MQGNQRTYKITKIVHRIAQYVTFENIVFVNIEGCTRMSRMNIND